MDSRRPVRRPLWATSPQRTHPPGVDDPMTPRQSTPVSAPAGHTIEPAIVLKDVTKMFSTPSGGVYTALKDLDLSVAPGEFCAVVGPTGCGKSTTLTLISGLERPTRGTATVEGRPVRGLTPGVGFVFQN